MGNSPSAGQGVCWALMNSEVHCCVKNRLSL